MYLSDKLSPEIFERLFPVILTDNGGEFKAPETLEFTSYGSQRTRVFFCDPMASWQKPHIERSHEYIRQIIPKGIPMDDFTQEDITLMLNHINSLSRDSLNGLCPFDAAKQLLGRKLPKLLAAILSPLCKRSKCVLFHKSALSIHSKPLSMPDFSAAL